MPFPHSNSHWSRKNDPYGKKRSWSKNKSSSKILMLSQRKIKLDNVHCTKDNTALYWNYLSRRRGSLCRLQSWWVCTLYWGCKSFLSGCTRCCNTQGWCHIFHHTRQCRWSKENFWLIPSQGHRRYGWSTVWDILMLSKRKIKLDNVHCTKYNTVLYWNYFSRRIGSLCRLQSWWVCTLYWGCKSFLSGCTRSCNIQGWCHIFHHTRQCWWSKENFWSIPSQGHRRHHSRSFRSIPILVHSERLVRDRSSQQCNSIFKFNTLGPFVF